MKSTTELLSELRKRDIHIQLDGDTLRVNAPKGSLNADLQAQLTRNKQEIIQLLQRQTAQMDYRIPESNRADLLPLSPAQERVWHLHLFESGNPTLNVAGVWRVHGRIDVPRLKAALEKLVQRHEILRTRIEVSASEPYQRVLSVDEIQPPELSHKILEAGSAFPERSEIRERLSPEMSRPFNLEQPPLFRSGVFTVNPEEHVFYMVFHQIVIDGEVLASLLSELTSHYADLPLEPLPLQFGDYAVWSRKYLLDHNESLNRFWHDVFYQTYKLLPIPASSDPASSSVSIPLASDRADRIHRFVKENGTTPFVLGISLYQILLGGYCDAQDVVVFTTAAGRTFRELQGLIGLFAHPIAIRSQLSPTEPFRQWLGRVNLATQGAVAHKELPLDKILENVRIERQREAHGLFQAMFTLEADQKFHSLAADVVLENLSIGNQRAQFDMHLHLALNEESAGLILEYRNGVLSEQQARTILEDLEGLLNRVLDNPEVPIQSLTESLTGKNTFQQAGPAESDRRDRVSSAAKPRNDLEIQLKKIWEKVFEIEEIGIYDDFFDLGGDSMLAIRLFKRIETSLTGEMLPLTLLTEARTIAGIAEALETKEWDRAGDTLVPIKPYGDRTPFFCINSGHGLLLNFYELASLLEADRPFYGLRIQEWIEGESPTSVGGIAEIYIKRIKSIQPEGPYLLGGYCFGGQVAFEVAHSLEKMGDVVGLVVLIDSYAPGAAVRLKIADPFVVRNIKRVWRAFKEFRKRKGIERYRYLRYFFVHGWSRSKKMISIDIIRPARRKGWRLLRQTLEKLNLELPAFLKDVHMARHEAAAKYRPKPISGPVLSIQAQGRSTHFEYHEDMGWSPFANGTLDIEVIPGNHHTIWDHPNNVVFRDVLQQYFKQINL